MAHTKPFLIQDIYETSDKRLNTFQAKPGFKDRIKKIAITKAKVLHLSNRAQASKDRENQDIISRFKDRT